MILERPRTPIPLEDRDPESLTAEEMRTLSKQQQDGYASNFRTAQVRIIQTSRMRYISEDSSSPHSHGSL
ncbi:hypothetical protein R6Q59_010086 [Mikania micrantha]